MRYSELGGKEIIDLDNGERMGVVGQSDMIIDPSTGKIESIILPTGSLLNIGRKKEEVMIPWKAIRKIGSEMIIVEMKERTAKD
ncbi:YlmC/YmxH family sporulation protein [Aneurinibacillus aneurinilyticus]|uniref:Sporulation protein, YlmC/YmxH family n=1 Tax=Aneurinibacillus aneurinilyticus ATCC 12856 TaxID=649747 RepID=U1WKL1_ANEAE|nr:YlmC/YmxH family sporulation protein [Aneurinibacillus aneurinilyticus]ERI09134.1 sporulation protein, YlmC/YmxH family [Aneurinibacillus aneurinilyticus ATCC 12856]MED0707379.1 YlmC/YmxH family sporulation protein [Aneurinibacillus aneurinilyticus]MED0724813.1 YlmC/YmxH family sporulation protein [Aneurinibacillus aneurinilyticus]MED0733263.1 YlmC/YmxH family sporulation protein [Aneurinibacillus aneurinilyticus]MED0742760.1 YlmC/YmxH family sporulation protein [Aneurinibacillus aneurinily